MEDVDVTILVVTHNRAQMLYNALETLANQKIYNKLFYEILVIDDGSTDQTSNVVKNIQKNYLLLPIRYIYKDRGGSGSSRNKGVENARGQWIAFFDDDQLADPNWLAELYKMAQERGADCIGGPAYPDLGGFSYNKLGPISRQIFSAKVSSRIKENSLKNYLSGGNVLIRRSVFKKLGNFDCTLPYGEDTDFFWRIERGGLRTYYAPQALVHHVIPEYRLRPSYMRGYCFLKGIISVKIYRKYEGPLKLVISNLWRIGVSLLRDIPLILIGCFCNNRSFIFDGMNSLWYTFGFINGTLSSSHTCFKGDKFIRLWVSQTEN